MIKKNNLICASDAVTYAVFTELKCERSSIVSCTYCVILELCSCHVFFLHIFVSLHLHC